MTRRKRNDHWLNTQLWKLPIGEWISLILALGAIVSLLCILLIRRHTLEYHLAHTFTISDPEFFGSALALSPALQSRGYAINQFALDAVPYVVTLLALVILGRRRANEVPEGLSKVFDTPTAA